MDFKTLFEEEDDEDLYKGKNIIQIQATE